MNRRYLVFDSTYRNRYQYSSPSDYVIPFQKSIGNTIWTATNATTKSYPISNFHFIPQREIYCDDKSTTVTTSSTTTVYVSVEQLPYYLANNSNFTSNWRVQYRGPLSAQYTPPEGYVISSVSYSTTTSLLTIVTQTPITGYAIGGSFRFFQSQGTNSASIYLTVSGGTASAPQVRLDQVNLYTGIGITGAQDYPYYATMTEAENVFLNLSVTYIPSLPPDSTLALYPSLQVIQYDSVNGIFVLSSTIPNWTSPNPVATGYLPAYLILSNPSLGYAPSSTYSIVLQNYNLINLGPNSNTNGYFISNSSPLFLVDMNLMEIQPCVYDGNISVTLSAPFSSEWNVCDFYMLHINQPPSDIGVLAIIPDTEVYYRIGAIAESFLSSAGSGYSVGVLYHVVNDYQPENPNLWAQIKVESVGPLQEITSFSFVSYGCYYQHGQLCSIRAIEGSSSPSVSSFAQLFIETEATLFCLNSTANVVLSPSAYVGSWLLPFLVTSAFTDAACTPVTTNSPSLLVSPNNTIPRTFSPLDQASMDQVDNLFSSDVFYGSFPIIKADYVPNQPTCTYVWVQGLLKTLLSRYDVLTGNPLFNENQNMFLGYSVLPFTRDSVNALDFSGTMVSSNQPVCYQMSLLSLILPNLTLALPFGGLTSSYPYVFAQISNDQNNNLSLIYSNNPNANTATFLCSISDVQSPVISKYLKISGDGSSQIVKFRANDNLHIRIFMPDGSLFQPEVQDYMPPLNPNILVQIFAHVEITRLG